MTNKIENTVAEEKVATEARLSQKIESLANARDSFFKNEIVSKVMFVIILATLVFVAPFLYGIGMDRMEAYNTSSTIKMSPSEMAKAIVEGEKERAALAAAAKAREDDAARLQAELIQAEQDRAALARTIQIVKPVETPATNAGPGFFARVWNWVTYPFRLMFWWW